MPVTIRDMVTEPLIAFSRMLLQNVPIKSAVSKTNGMQENQFLNVLSIRRLLGFR